MVSGLALRLTEGDTDEFTVSADGLDADFEYRYSFLLTTGGSGGIGFDSLCSLGSEAISVPRGNTSWSASLTLYACRIGTYTLTTRLYEYSIGESEEYLLETDRKTVRVLPPPPPTAAPPPDVSPVLPSVQDRTYEVGDDVNLLLPRASGGNPPLAYSVDGLPSTLRFSPSARRITGRPSRAGEHSITYSVEDDDGDTDEETFTITVEEPDTEPSLPSVRDRTYEVGDNVNLLLPRASGGNPPLTYSASGLPSGLQFSSSDRRITGRPSRAGEHSITYSVEDDDGDTDEETFTITVEETPGPPELDAPPVPGSVSANTVNQDNVLLSWDLREGVANEQVRFRVRGSTTWPPAVEASPLIFAGRGTGRYTSRIADLDPDTMYEFEVRSFGDGTRWRAAWGDWSDTVRAKTFRAPTLSIGVPDGGLEMDGSAGITVNAGDLAPTLAYRLSIATGTHTGFDAGCSTGVRSVNLPVQAGRTSYAWPLTLHGCSVGTDTLTARLYEAHDDDSETERVTAEDTVSVGCPTPDFGSESVTDQSWQQNSPIDPFDLPAASGGCGSLSYQLSPDLPDGVTRSAAHRVSGTPTATMSRTRYTWTAENSEGETDELTFHVTVELDNVPTFGNRTVPEQSWRQDVAIDPLDLPLASGGDGTLTYELDPDLPDGVTRNLRTHRVSGTPTVTMARSRYTWTARDEDGDTATLNFHVTVTLVPLPPPPDGLRATAVSQDSILLSWGRPEGVDREQLHYRIKDSGPWSGPVPAETIVFAGRGAGAAVPASSLITGLDPGTTYEFEMQSFGDGQRWQAAWGDWSDTAEDTTFPAATLAITVPDDGLEASGSVSITVNAGDLAPTLAYRLSIGTGTHTGFDAECATGVRSVNLPVQAGRTSYAWPLTLHGCSVGADTLTARLNQVDEEGEQTERATADAEVSVTPPRMAAPAVTAGGGSLDVGWTPLSGEFAITLYVVRHKLTADPDVRSSWTQTPAPASDGTPKTLPGLSNRSYDVQVRACTSSHICSAWSESTPGTPLPVITIEAAGSPPVMEGQQVQFTLRADPAPARNLTVKVDVGQTGGPFLTTTEQRTVIIGSGSTSADLFMTTENDEIDEPDGRVLALIDTTSSDYAVGTPASASVDVEDDDVLLDAPDVDVTPLPLRKARISWAEVDNATGYEVSNNTRNNLNKAGCSAPPASTTALSFEICLDEYLADNMLDTFSISAVDSTGTYVQSASADIRVVDNPILTGGSANGYSPGGTGQAVVKWAPVAGATEYTLRWRKLPDHEVPSHFQSPIAGPATEYAPHSDTRWRLNPAISKDDWEEEDLGPSVREYTVPDLDNGEIYGFQITYEYFDGTGFSAREAYAWISGSFPGRGDRVATYPFFGHWPNRTFDYTICENTFPSIFGMPDVQSNWTELVEEAFRAWEIPETKNSNVKILHTNRTIATDCETTPMAIARSQNNSTNEVMMVGAKPNEYKMVQTETRLLIGANTADNIMQSLEEATTFSGILQLFSPSMFGPALPLCVFLPNTGACVISPAYVSPPLQAETRLTEAPGSVDMLIKGENRAAVTVPQNIVFNNCTDGSAGEYTLILHEAGHALGLSGFSRADLFFGTQGYEMAHSTIADSALNYDGRLHAYDDRVSPEFSERDCSLHPFDVMAIHALYQSEPSSP